MVQDAEELQIYSGFGIRSADMKFQVPLYEDHLSTVVGGTVVGGLFGTLFRFLCLD